MSSQERSLAGASTSFRQHAIPFAQIFEAQNSGTVVPQTWSEFEQLRENTSKGIFGRVRETSDGCWEFFGCNLQSKPYPAVVLRKKAYRLSRLFWIIFNGGELSREVHICHTCDNPRCINPKHLVAGTNALNQEDCTRKGRRGVLGMDKARAIRALRADGASLDELAATYNVGVAAICAVVEGRSWKEDPRG